MDAQVALLLVWTGLVLLTAELKWTDAAEMYTNTWAVQINGGLEEADRIAKEHGFINQGNVSSTHIILCCYCTCRRHTVLCRLVSDYLS